MDKCNTKANVIREMLLKTVGKDPDLFCYWTSIQEAKELLNQSKPFGYFDFDHVGKNNYKPTRKLTDC